MQDRFRNIQTRNESAHHSRGAGYSFLHLGKIQRDDLLMNAGEMTSLNRVCNFNKPFWRDVSQLLKTLGLENFVHGKKMMIIVRPPCPSVRVGQAKASQQVVGGFIIFTNAYLTKSSMPKSMGVLWVQFQHAV